MDYEITTEQLKSLLDAQQGVTVLDVREPWEYEVAKIATANTLRWVTSRRDLIRSLIPRTTSLWFAITEFAR